MSERDAGKLVNGFVIGLSLGILIMGIGWLLS